MRGSRTGLVLAIAAAAILSAGAIPAGAIHKFGDVPLSHVQQKANDANHCGGDASAAKLKARALSISWNESVFDDSDVPAPMTLSRFDRVDRLYWNNRNLPNQNYKRMFWNPGVGIWQWDDSSSEGGAVADAKFSSEWGAGQAIDHIRSQLCDNKNPYQHPWGTYKWVGCASGGCANDYNQIYDPNGSLNDFDGSANVQTRGGAETDRCYWYGSDSPAWDCLWVKIPASQGDDWWKYDPDSSQSDWTPLAYPFIIWRDQNNSGAPIEVRYWMKQDTGISHSTKVQRPIGQNSRDAGVLSWYDHPDKLCLVTRSICSDG